MSKTNIIITINIKYKSLVRVSTIKKNKSNFHATRALQNTHRKQIDFTTSSSMHIHSAKFKCTNFFTSPFSKRFLRAEAVKH